MLRFPIDGPAEANLRSLPLMERELELKEFDDGSLGLWDGDTLVLEAHAGGVPVHEACELRGLEQHRRSVHVAGFPVISLRLATSGSDGAIYAYLEDVAPDEMAKRAQAMMTGGGS